MTLPFPSTGKSKEEVLAIMRAARDHDVQWQKGRAFSLVYHAGKDVDELLKEASLLFFSENGLNPTAPIPAAWAVLNYLGESGYLELTDLVMKAARRLREGVHATPGLKVISDPEMSVFAIGSDGIDVYAVADELTARNWHLDRQQFPPTLGSRAIADLCRPTWAGDIYSHSGGYGRG